MANIGIQPHIIEAVLNHVSGHKAGVAGIYNRATYAPRRPRPSRDGMSMLRRSSMSGPAPSRRCAEGRDERWRLDHAGLDRAGAVILRRKKYFPMRSYGHLVCMR